MQDVVLAVEHGPHLVQVLTTCTTVLVGFIQIYNSPETIMRMLFLNVYFVLGQ